ncbi:ead/Ea22-like family protein [Raoultella ornithinolytica]|uniref:ead/Ea22-like family protein n=1 Tax=Raoultella ornithinolytica TaxID=54291 RepID=UPI00292BA1FE|nr:ead/Ea22-like family protein [Raoultella ornithinolytica]MDV0591950.1 ead/Ea22-like family protein [Raoultella ornithinolytica]
MTIDITELAQSLKAAAEKATPGPWALARDRKTVVSNQSHPIANLSDAMHRMLSDGTTGQDAEFISLANPANILALVEALEKAQQLATQQGNISCAIFDEVTAQSQRIAELEEAEQQLCAANVTLDARAKLAESQLAELESRTVTLPKPHAHLIWIQAGHAPDDYWDDVAVSHSEKDRCCDGSERYPVYVRWEIEEMLAAAGIKVEAE